LKRKGVRQKRRRKRGDKKRDESFREVKATTSSLDRREKGRKEPV